MNVHRFFPPFNEINLLTFFHLRQISLFVNVSQFTTLHIGFRLAVLRNPETITTAFENRQKFRRRVNFQ